jgi:hypothetical protein
VILKEESRQRVFENRVLRRMFAFRRDELKSEWGKQHNEEPKVLYSLNIFRVIKIRRMRWAGHVARMGERRGIYRVLVGNPLRKRDYWVDPGVDGRILLIWGFRKWYVGFSTGSIWLRIWAGGRHL